MGKIFLIFGFLGVSNLGWCDWRESFRDFCESKESGVGFAWLKLAPVARGISLGDAYLSVVDGPEAIFWNPAGLGKKSGWEANFTHWQHFMGIRHEFLGLSYRSGANAYGFGVSGVFTGEIEHRNEQQELKGEYKVYDFLGSFSYARRLEEGLYFGGTIKGIYERIHIYELSSWLLDFGVIYRAYPGLWVGGTFVNLGPSPAFENEEIKPPRCWKLGISYEKERILISLDANKYIDQVLGTGIGVEYKISPFFCVRGGYRAGNESYCLSGGFGVRVGGFKFDYAFRPYGLELGSAHILTLTR
jgi:hypothetical protein